MEERTRMIVARAQSLVLVLGLVTAAPTAQTQKPAYGTPLEGTYWKAVELSGKPLPPQDAKREAHLLVDAAGRVSGSDGCNRITGSCQLKGNAIAFGPIAATRMACANTAAVEEAFHNALKGASRFTIAGDRLELFDAAGTRLAAFVAGIQAAAIPGLGGTSWQLARFQGSDDTTRTPDERATYTIEFAADGRLTARIDCNKGRGTWQSSGPNQLTLGPLALTRGPCPPGSLHDHIVKQWDYIRSYIIKDGRLFLSRGRHYTQALLMENSPATQSASIARSARPGLYEY
jgi:heat shock protein HslJ